MFNLQANDVATASISGSSANDDEFLDVLLNGNSLGINTWGFTAYKDLIIPAGSPFIAGTNAGFRCQQWSGRTDRLAAR